CMFPAKIENLRRNPVCLQRYRHVVARKRQHGLTTTLIYATTPSDTDDTTIRAEWSARRIHLRAHPAKNSRWN
ncbi:hypothetical protein, partial [Ralstonia pseudosolanacearum]|uniref:hypothetical protein n=1 Tax=Ralstonia pseudosolanacearum TaxID=1310165 RepID=UPI00200511B6